MSKVPNEKVKARNLDRALQNAYKLFLENGIERTTVEMLARATGISRSSLDRYFNGKVDLVLQTAKWVGENVRDKSISIRIFSQEPGLTGLEMLKRYLQIVLDLLHENPRLFVLGMELRAFVFRNSAEYPSAQETVNNSLGSSLLLEKILERGMEDGSINLNLNAKAEAIYIRESTLGFLSSVALISDPALLKEHNMADLFIARIIQRY